MSNVRKFVYAILAVVAAGVAFLGWSVFDTWRRLPEAYAAWDVGTMLVCFMERNDNRWPSSWNELADSIKPDDECVFCRGVEYGEDRHHGYPKTIEKLKRMVRIDWKFVPTKGEMQYPITTSDGKRFTVVWSGAEPNEMVYNWIMRGEKDSGKPL